MRVTICEFGPRDGEVIEIPDGAHEYRFPVTRPAAANWVNPPYEQRLVGWSFRTRYQPASRPFEQGGPWAVVTYLVQEYRHPEDHDTRFALVHPDVLRRMLGN